MIEYMIHIFDVSVIDSEGHLVSQQQLMGSTSGLNLRGLTSGVYTVKVFIEQELQSTTQILVGDS